jgi:Flp pilus assembly protein TadG
VKLAQERQNLGQSLVEFALILPVLLLILMGVFDFGRAIYAFNAVSNAAREGARTAIVDQSVSGGSYVAAQAAADQATALGLDPADPADVDVTFPDTSGVGMCANPGVGCTVRVEVHYEFEPLTPIIGSFIGPIDVSAVTEMPIEFYKP